MVVWDYPCESRTSPDLNNKASAQSAGAFLFRFDVLFDYSSASCARGVSASMHVNMGMPRYKNACRDMDVTY